MHRRRRLALVVALAALLVLAGCSGGGNGDAGTGGVPSAGGAGGGTGAVPGGGEASQVGSYYRDGERVVVRSATMELTVGEFDAAFDAIQGVARDNGGFVADWDHQVERGWDRGTLRVRVPADRFTETRNDLAALGTVEDESVRAEDFTVEVADIEARLADLRTERRALRDLLNRTDDVEEARQVREDLRAVSQETTALQRRETEIRRREALSTIEVRVHEPTGEKPPANYETAYGFDDAFLDAVYGGLRVTKYAVVFVGYAIPVGLTAMVLGALGLVGVRTFRVGSRWLGRVLPGGRTGGDGSDGPDGARPPEESDAPQTGATDDAGTGEGDEGPPTGDDDGGGAGGGGDDRPPGAGR